MKKKILITGGAGFIGVNSAKRFLDEAYCVVIFDSLARFGCRKNLQWLKTLGRFDFIKGDIRDFRKLESVFRKYKNFDVVLHEAAQVAVTTSVVDPRTDFETNALGSFNLCEAVRKFSPEAILLNPSTNKVYGAMEDVQIIEENGKYKYVALASGVAETRPLDFHSPYGCSKGTADQYVHDYSRIYGLRTVNFRQSCIYGFRQFGLEDQGWVAWFTICAVLGKPVTIYGDGKQVRDVLFIDDLVELYMKSIADIEKAKGESLNVGGGAGNTLSLLELISMLENLMGKKLRYNFSDWRPGDQKVYISDITKAQRVLNWSPKISAAEGVKRLYSWVLENKGLFA